MALRVNDPELIALIDRLRAEPREAEWFEFKGDHVAPERLGQYVSGLANSAGRASRDHGYLVLGVDDDSHEVVGTSFDPATAKAKGNQSLVPWLCAKLEPNPGVEFRIATYSGDRRAVLMSVGAATNGPVRFDGTGYIRIGSDLTTLDKHREIEAELWSLKRDWSAKPCDSATLGDLDPDAIAKAREQFALRNTKQAESLRQWDDETFLSKLKLLKHGRVTNAALLLLGGEAAPSIVSPAVARISWVLRDATKRDLDYAHFDPPFVVTVDRVLERIRNLTVRVLPSGTLFPRELSQYDPWVVREALHNAIAHQDYRLHGKINVVEYPDRIVLSNVGSFLPGSVERVIEDDVPPEVYRNPFLASAMVSLGLIDTRGGGIRRMYVTQQQRGFPLPDFDLSEPNRVVVTVDGRVRDERYTRLLMERADLELFDVIQLDHVQKGLRITRDEHRRLKAHGLVEGRYPNTIIAGGIARLAGHAGRHLRERGFRKQYYLDMILALVREAEPVSRQDVDDALLSALPGRLSHAQRRKKIQNLLGELSRAGRIVNRGSRGSPKWTLGRSDAGQAKVPPSS
ncbi:MAG: putative DNA binding domain-containing protein [Planctomycetes bacterium]|nr:putative DNA binding domain-containing protein [Planctomycetota bacterium]